MIKRFCDVCGEEMTDHNAVKFDGDNDRLKTELKSENSINRTKLQVEVTLGKNSTWNDGDVCKYCILDALYSLDDRPRAG